ncbi:tyrosine-type recombinase/integrase [Caballeronia ptereochthonis]|nr:site-specific integrase [Caballeronia ptereochthonis]
MLAYFGSKTVFELEADTSLIYDYIDARLQTISERTKRKMSNTSVRLEVAALAAVVEFAKRRKIVRENFVSHISRPTTKRRKRRVTMQEQKQLQHTALSSENEFLARAARFLLLIRHLGCRPGELKTLQITDLYLGNKELVFQDTKNHTDRRIHVTEIADMLLRKQLETVPDKCPYLFWTASKEGEFVEYHYRSGVDSLRDLGIIQRDYHAHAGRREFISRAIESNISLGTIKKQTGHKSTAALEIYDEGLSTAPEIRAAFDELAEKVKKEQVRGTLQIVGETEEWHRLNVNTRAE